MQIRKGRKDSATAPSHRESEVYITGGAAKSIQSINVAVAAAAAFAGLASPAVTHSTKKLCVWRKTALFLSLSVFF